MIADFVRMRFGTRAFRIAARFFAMGLLAGTAACQDMSPRDYYIFGRPSTSQSATQPPQPVARPAPSTPAEAPVVSQPAPLLEAPVSRDRPVVALLLPLSGANAALGRALFDAAALAAFDIGDDEFVLLPRDTAGTPEGAADAARGAIEAGARLIIGPLFGAEVPAVAAVAQPAGVNVVTLSNDRGVAAPGVFIFGLSPFGQIERTVAFARSRGMTRFAALLPNNPFGAAVEESLRRTALAVGAQVTMVERYDPGAGDATPAVRRLASYEARRQAVAAQRRELEGRDDDLSRLALRRLDGIETVGEVGFDAIVLPDFGDRLLSIAPLLPYYDIDPARVRLLGTTFWEDPRVTREPALVGAWFPAPPLQARADFQRRFRQVYGGDPPAVAMLAYDAAALAAVLARAEGGPNFSPTAISNPNGFAGVGGVFRFRPDGTADRGYAVLEVRRDGFRTISPALDDFRDVTR